MATQEKCSSCRSKHVECAAQCALALHYPGQGKEFALHARVTIDLGVAFYFPEPSQPWQRGSNENTNGLLRLYFPKYHGLGQYSEAEIQSITDKINLRPRKCLGWKCAYEVLFRKTLHLV